MNPAVVYWAVANPPMCIMWISSTLANWPSSFVPSIGNDGFFEIMQETETYEGLCQGLGRKLV